MVLLNLHVKNLAIIDEVEVDFSQKLNVLTGETGAGKSIIIGSINLALGGKLAKDSIRKGAEYALVELVFSVDTPQQRQALENLGVTVEEGELLISRRLTGTRSVNRINGESVTLSTIRQVASILIDIHGQNEQQSLLHQAKHMEILDRYAKDEMGTLQEQMAKEYGIYQELVQKQQESQIPEEERLREISFMEFELEEIENAHLISGEEEELEAEYRKLSHGVAIAQGLSEVYGMTGQGENNALEQLDRSMRIMRKLEEYDEQMQQFSSQLSDIDSLLSDFNRDVWDYMSDFESGDGRLAEVESRLDLVRNIKAKYGNTTKQVLEYAQEKQKKLQEYKEYEEYREKLSARIKKQELVMKKLAGQITKVRNKKARILEKDITQALIDLNFLQVDFAIAIRPLEHFTAKGMDEVEFMLSTNPGEDKKPIGQAASGGELSRIMLAVKAVLAEHDSIPTLIFDEIDVGISGRTAQMVAEKMAYIGKSHQVICISHLAQIAAMADAHYLIEKTNNEKHTSTTIYLLNHKQSVGELARIIGGVQITDAVMKNAEEMKKMAQEVKLSLR